MSSASVTPPTKLNKVITFIKQLNINYYKMATLLIIVLFWVFMLIGDVMINKIAFNASKLECVHNIITKSDKPPFSSIWVTEPYKLDTDEQCIIMSSVDYGIANMRIVFHFISMLLIIIFVIYLLTTKEGKNWLPYANREDPHNLLKLILWCLGILFFIFACIGLGFLANFIYNANNFTCEGKNAYCYDFKANAQFTYRTLSISGFIITFAVTALLCYLLYGSKIGKPKTP